MTMTTTSISFYCCHYLSSNCDIGTILMCSVYLDVYLSVMCICRIIGTILMCSSVYPVHPEYPVCTQPAGASSNLQPFHLPPLLVVVNVIILSLSAMEIILFCCKGEGFEGKVSSISVFSPFKGSDSCTVCMWMSDL